jgi:hypothetical protein
MTTTALQTIKPDEWSVMQQQATMLVKTGFLPKSITTPEQAVAIIMTGRELSIPPMAALNTINVIQGKPTVSPQLMLALINRSGQLEDMKIETGGEGATCTMKRRLRQPFTARFGPAEAKAMGLSGKDNYSKQPATMYQWRAVAMAARAVFPDVILGLYTPEEMGAEVGFTAEGEMFVEAEAPRAMAAGVGSSAPVVTEGNGAPAPSDEREREIVVEQILSLASDCGIERAELDAMIRQKFKVTEGLDSLGANGLAQVQQGLVLRREMVELARNAQAVAEEKGLAGILDEHLQANYEGRTLAQLKAEELRAVILFLNDDAPVF